MNTVQEWVELNTRVARADVQAAERLMRVLFAGLPPAGWAHTPVTPAPVASEAQVMDRLIAERDAARTEVTRLTRLLDEKKRQLSKALVECHQAEQKAQREHDLCVVAENRADELAEECDALIDEQETLKVQVVELQAELRALRCGGASCSPGLL